MNRFFTILPKQIVGQLLIFCPIFILSLQEVNAENYFQQEVNFEILVTLNDRNHELNAFETIEYINNSPDTLDYLYFHLWPNAYSGNETELAKRQIVLKGKSKLFKDPELKGCIDSLDFRINNLPVQWDLLSGQPDICKIVLNRPIRPGDTVHITTPFHVKIPKGVTSRLGHIGDSYQISQWYPKPAVYDISGWHPMSYLDQGEFYSEFGRYDVRITLPDNYILGATGDLQNQQEMVRLDSLASDTTWIAAIDSAGLKFPPSSTKWKTLRYTQAQIHDFAWFADKRFHVMKGKVTLPESGKEITTWVMCTNKQAKLWKDAIPYMNAAIRHFSEWIGDYPYKSVTAVQSTLNAGIGMEYPGITVIGWVEDAYALDRVIAHEIGHNWFYSALGSDERRYPFMDESMTSALEVRYMDKCYPGMKLSDVYFSNKKLAKFISQEMPVKRIQELQWLVPARNNLEQPLNLTSTAYSNSNYGSMIYDKGAIGFNYLRAYLGDSLFDATIQEYYSKWKFRHPQPNDLRQVFESSTGKDLSWFFNDFIGTTKRLDYKVIRLKDQKLLVENNAELVSPLVLTGLKGDSIRFQMWVEGFKGKQWIELPEGDFTEIKIDHRHSMPELYRLNNNIHRSGLFPKSDPVRTQFLLALEDPDKRTLMYIPAINWSRESGIMAGALIHNGYMVPKPLEFVFMPFYSFKNPGLYGSGNISYNITPFNQKVRKVTFSLEGVQYAAPGDQNYHKAKVGLEINFRAKSSINPVMHQVFGYYIAASDLSQINLLEKAKMNSYVQLGYQMERIGAVNPFKLLTAIESGERYRKAAATFHYRYSYFGRNNGLDFRFFAGGMLKDNSEVPFYGFAASGRNGREQYLYQGTYPDRFTPFPSTFWSRQMTLSEGGLVSPVNERLGYSKWLVSVSLTSDLPGQIGWMEVKPFVNLLLNDHDVDNSSTPAIFFEAGLKTGIWNLFEISVPLVVSGNISSITGSFKDRIRFIFNLDSFNKMKFNLAEMF